MCTGTAPARGSEHHHYLKRARGDLALATAFTLHHQQHQDHQGQ